MGMSVRLAGTRIFLEITQPKIIKLFLRADRDLRFPRIQLQEKFQTHVPKHPLDIRVAGTDFCQARPIVNKKASKMVTG